MGLQGNKRLYVFQCKLRSYGKRTKHNYNS